MDEFEKGIVEYPESSYEDKKYNFDKNEIKLFEKLFSIPISNSKISDNQKLSKSWFEFKTWLN